MNLPYRILDRKRRGEALSEAAIREVVAGAASGGWTDAQLAAFLMAAAIHGLDEVETQALTLGMMRSGELWQLSQSVPGLCDKHSTGGVGDKLSLVLSPILAACGLPVAMLTGRSLGHTGGTVDKLQSVPGLDLALSRERCLRLLGEVGVAIGMATEGIAPADRRLYGLRDQTGTVESRSLITASICSKKLALGPQALVFDVKVGNGAFLETPAEAEALAGGLVSTCRALGVATSALLTDMNQPLGDWAGNQVEVFESAEVLQGRGGPEVRELALGLAAEVAELSGSGVTRRELEAAVDSGRAYERFLDWAVAQGARRAWFDGLTAQTAPCEHVLVAPRAGWIQQIDTKQLGLLLMEAGVGGHEPDPGVALHTVTRLGRRVATGDELARLYLRKDDAALAQRAAACLVIGEEASSPPPLVHGRIGGRAASY